MSLIRKSYKQCNNKDDEDELFEVRNDGIRRPASHSVGKKCCKFCYDHLAVVVVILLLFSALVITAIIFIIFLPEILAKHHSSNIGESTSKLSPVVQTNCGAFVGAEEGGAFAFKVSGNLTYKFIIHS